MRWGLLPVFFLLPVFAQAAVFINEVAWMGDANSANHEWIELYNDGAAVVLDNWLLSSKKQNGETGLNVELTGTIPAQSYVVLERSSEESAPTAAWLIYTGALGNDGGSLALYDAQGQLVDQVSGGGNWDLIGGDNTTKATAQRSQSGWLTAAATPGKANHTQGIKQETESVTEENQSQSDDTQQQNDTKTNSTKDTPAKSKVTKESVRLTLPDVTLKLAIDSQSVGYVNQTIPFGVKASGIGENLISSLSYQWNFGDGNVSNVQSPQHVFAFPGRYVVTVHAQFKRQRQTTRHEITVLPVKLSLTQNSSGDIQLNNDSPYEIDISGYTVKGQADFVFPKYSLILPNQTVTIPRAKIADSYPVLATVHDAHQVQLASLPPQSPLTTNTSYQRVQNTPTVAHSKKTPTTAIVAGTQPVPSLPLLAPAEPESNLVAKEETTFSSSVQQKANQLNTNSPNNQLAAVAAAADIDNLTRKQRLSYVGLAIIILLATMAIYLTPRRKQDT